MHCTDTLGFPDPSNDIIESDLDIEWVGAIATDAIVDFIYTAHIDPNQDVIDALRYAVEDYSLDDGTVVAVISISYGGCEQGIESTGVSYLSNLAMQASAQGQTIVASSGDSGAAGCDPQGINTTSTYGLSVSLPAAIPSITGVGGSILSGDESDPALYWNSSTGVVNTALLYIPETARWNETGTQGLLASGGGVSVFFPQPDWQPTPSGFSGTPGRFVPDVAFSAASHDGYLICAFSNCTTGFADNSGDLARGRRHIGGRPLFCRNVGLAHPRVRRVGKHQPGPLRLGGRR